MREQKFLECADLSALSEKRRQVAALQNPRLPRLLAEWLRHADARQVYDLPKNALFILPGLRPQLFFTRLAGKSETYRASEWRSHFGSRSMNQSRNLRNDLIRPDSRRVI